MTNKKKFVVATSLLAVAAAAGVAIGTTTALFKDEVETSIHINAGKLNVGFYLEEIKYDEVQGSDFVTSTVDLEGVQAYSGYLDEVQIGETTSKMLNLKKYNVDPAVNFENIYPTMGGSMKFVIVNKSSIAVEVESSISLGGTIYCNEDGELLEESREMTETELGLYHVEDTLPDETLPTIQPDGYLEFTISFTLDHDAGNEFQGSKLTVDPKITVTQIAKSSSTTD